MYKVVEISTVTDEEIEKTLNQCVVQGYSFESIQFVVTESSRRPKMAFLFFTKKKDKGKINSSEFRNGSQ